MQWPCEKCGGRLAAYRPGALRCNKCGEIWFMMNRQVYDYFDSLGPDEEPTSAGWDAFRRN